MKLIVLVSWLSLTHAGFWAEGNGATINGVYHTNETLVSHLLYTSFLSFDHINNNLYFDFTTWVANNTWDSHLAKINLKDNVITIFNISGRFRETTYAIDHKEEIAYMGAPDGVYKYDLKNNRKTLFGAKGRRVEMVYFKHLLYFRERDNEQTTYYKWYVFQNDSYSLFEDLKDMNTMSFVIDDDNMIYFTSLGGLCRKKVGVDNITVIKASRTFVTSVLALDLKGRLYVKSWTEGVYPVVNETVQSELVLPRGGLSAVTWDSEGRMICAVWTSGIYRLAPYNATHSGTLKLVCSSVLTLALISISVFVCFIIIKL